MPSPPTVTDLRPLARVCAWCEPPETTRELERRGFVVTHGMCEACAAVQRAERLSRRARIAAALIAQPPGVLGYSQIALETVPAEACRIDRELDEITRGEEEQRRTEAAAANRPAAVLDGGDRFARGSYLSNDVVCVS